MRSLWKLGVVAWLMAGAVFIGVVYSGSAAKAAEPSIWTDGSPITVTDIAQLGDDQVGRLQCSVLDIKLKQLKDPTKDAHGMYKLQSSNVQAQNVGPQCYTENRRGLITGSGGYWTKSEAELAVQIWSGTHGVLPVPGESGAVVMTNTASIGKEYSINYNLPGIGELDINSSRRVIWRLTSMAPYLRYADGSTVKFERADFSANGRYMLALLASKVLVRIDLQTRSLLPITKVTFGQGSPLGGMISDDGRYVVNAYGGLKLHDLSACSGEYAEGGWPASVASQTVFPGCVQRDIFSQVYLVFPFEKAGQMRFRPGNTVIDIELNRRAGGVVQWRRLELKSAHFTNPFGYIAMGDSFASGEGDTEGGEWYEPGTDEHGDEGSFEDRNLCHVSRRSYPYLIAQELLLHPEGSNTPSVTSDFHSYACSGAKMHNVSGGVFGLFEEDGNAESFAFSDNQYRYLDDTALAGDQPGHRKQTRLLVYEKIGLEERISKSPDSITLGIGGNDAGFGNTLLACVGLGTCEIATNDKAREELIVELGGQKPSLVRTYKKVMKESGARLYVVGYPVFVQKQGGTCALNVHFDDQERYAVAAATEYFNEVIKAAAAEAGAFYVDVSNILNDTNLCSGADREEMSVNGATAGDDRALSWVNSGVLKFGFCVARYCLGSESYHPNERAQMSYKQAILQQTDRLTRSMPVPQVVPVPEPDDFFGHLAKLHVQAVNGGLPTARFAELSESLLSPTGYREFTVSSPGFLRGSGVTIEIQSTPTVLGTTTVNQTGEFSFGAALPDDIEPGYHEVHVYGYDELGDAIHYYQPLLLGAQADNFDNDSTLNEHDSCPTIVNSSIDDDNDGVDDACDVFVEEVAEPTEETPGDDGSEEENEQFEENPKVINEPVIRGIPINSTGVEPTDGSVENASEPLAYNEEAQNTAPATVLGEDSSKSSDVKPETPIVAKAPIGVTTAADDWFGWFVTALAASGLIFGAVVLHRFYLSRK